MAQSPDEVFALVKELRLLHELTVAATRTESLSHLVFHALNSTVALTPYHRATFWDCSGSLPRLTGISGQSRISDNASILSLWTEVVAGIDDRSRSGILLPERFKDFTAEVQWKDLQAGTGALSVLWIPLTLHGRMLAGIWLERWQESAWSPLEIHLLERLFSGYAGLVALRSTRWLPTRDQVMGYLRRPRVRISAAILFLLLFALRVPLRVVAPCEVVARDPWTITAPLDGVLSEILVRPGSTVKKGDSLFRFDDEVLRKDLHVAEENVKILRSRLRRAEIESGAETKLRVDAVLLQHQLAQEEMRLTLARSRFAHREVLSPTDGLVEMEEAHRWQGRPVRQGERVLTLVLPSKTRLRIWVPEEDHLTLDPAQTVKAVFKVDPGKSYEAHSPVAGITASPSPGGVVSFLVEAEWEENDPGIRFGLQGHAVLYGEKVSPVYWLLRKPLATLRRFCGI